MNRILSLDPGHTTGVAVYSDEGVLEWSMAIPHESLTRLGFLNKLLSLASPQVVLIESLPQNFTDAKTKEVWYFFQSRLTAAAYSIVTIKPAEWKRFVERVEIPGQHARDAATMAKWWIENKEKNYVGSNK